MRSINREIVSALIFTRDNKLLLGLKDPEKGGVYAECWHIPGGGVDENETKEQALQREVLEETGISIAKYPSVLVDDQGNGETEKVLKGIGEKVLCKMHFNVYKVVLDTVASEVKLKPTDDLVEIRWFSIDELRTLLLTPPSQILFKRLAYI
jgi:8-oxo-dGTP pyrophosphatase MutT (NUDIX family)